MKQRGRPKKNSNKPTGLSSDVQTTSTLKQGDKVKCMTHPGVWTLVWYKDGDETCAIQNIRYRYIVKTSTLTKDKGE